MWFPWICQAFQLDIVPWVYFCFGCLCFWYQVQKAISKNDVKEARPLCFLLGELRSQVLHSSLRFCVWHGSQSTFILLHAAAGLFNFAPHVSASPGFNVHSLIRTDVNIFMNLLALCFSFCMRGLLFLLVPFSYWNLRMFFTHNYELVLHEL